MTSEISSLRNLGPRSAEWLADVGIVHPKQLQDLGAVVVFQMLRQSGHRPSLIMLYALEGALTDVHWTRISTERKEELRAALQSL